MLLSPQEAAALAAREAEMRRNWSPYERTAFLIGHATILIRAIQLQQHPDATPDALEALTRDLQARVEVEAAVTAAARDARCAAHALNAAPGGPTDVQ